VPMMCSLVRFSFCCKTADTNTNTCKWWESQYSLPWHIAYISFVLRSERYWWHRGSSYWHFLRIKLTEFQLVFLFISDIFLFSS
jgi:hypothetical protein